MRNLFDFLKKYFYWLVFVALEGVSLFMVFSFNLLQHSAWNTSASIVTGRLLEWKSGISAYVSLASVNKKLMTENIILTQRADSIAVLLAEAVHDSTLTERRHARLFEGFKFIEAVVVNNNVRRRNNYLTIDKGGEDGLRPEMGVVCGTGIVGIVYCVSSHYSIVMSVLNCKSNISCRLRGTDYFGNLSWDGRNPLCVTLDDIPRHARIKVGMVVETSGFSAVFPAGIYVGNVVGVGDSEDGLSYKLQVNLGTDFARLRDVCVVDHPDRTEIKMLENKVQNEL